MKVERNIKNFQERKDIILKKFLHFVKDTEVEYNVKEKLKFNTKEACMDYDVYKFLYFQYINETVLSFYYERLNKDSEKDLFIGFIGLSQEEMDALDVSFNGSEYVENLYRETENISLYCKAIVDLDLSIQEHKDKNIIIDTIIDATVDEVDFFAISDCFGEFYSIQLKAHYSMDSENDFLNLLINILLDSRIFINKFFLDNPEFDFYNLLNVKEVDYYHILFGLLSKKNEDSFLCFYKVLESMFPVFYYNKLHYFFKESGKNMQELAIKLEEEANVRANEKESLTRIFDFYYSKNDLNDLEKVFNIKRNEELEGEELKNQEKKIINELADSFYQVRNSYVHGRWIFTTKQVNNKKNFQDFDRLQWSSIILFELKMIDACLVHAIKNDYFYKK